MPQLLVEINTILVIACLVVRQGRQERRQRVISILNPGMFQRESLLGNDRATEKEVQTL